MSPHPPLARRAAVAGALGLLLSAMFAAPAQALPPDRIGVFPTSTVAGSTATRAFTASSQFPATSVTTTSTTLAAPSGVTAFLGAGTGFGAEYGSTRAQPYLSIAPAAGGANSVTTVALAAAPPTGWGFALGDIDADWAFVQAYAGPGLTNPLPLAALGFRGVGNSCASTPRPGTCAAGPYTDAPVWVTAPETFDGISYVPGTLRGNSLPGAPAPSRDTSGAYGWFQPTAPVQTLQITYGVRDGSPIAQLWLAASAPRLTIEGQVSPAPAGTTVVVQGADGTPLAGLEDQPLEVAVDPQTGAYAVDVEQRADGYIVAVVPPAGFSASAPVAVAGVPDAPPDPTVSAPALTVAAIAAPSPSAPAPTPGPVAARPQLAESGGSSTAIAAVGAGAVLIATGALLLRRRARRS